MRGATRRGNVRAMSRRLAVLLAALIACGGSQPKPVAPPPPPPPVVAQPLPAPTDPDAAPLPLWPEVHQGKLANGMSYFIMKHGKPEKRALLWLAVNAGSVQEDEDQRGLAHFDEHMSFNGTKRFPKSAIVDYLEKIGMRFGADLNAYTDYDETVYQLEVPTDKPEFLDKGLDILRDWAGDVSYDPVEVDKERGVVKEEWRLGRGAFQRLFDKQSKILFQGSRYAVRQTIGLPEVLDKAPRDTLYRFYKDYYRPDLMAVIAVGDFDDTAAIEKEIQQKFGDLKNPAKERPRIHAGMPEAKGTRVSIETDKELPATRVVVYNLVPHRPEQSFKDFRRIVLDQVYNSILNERMSIVARHADAPFRGANMSVTSVTREIDGFIRSAQAKEGKVEASLESLFTEVLRVERHGVTQPELERARALLTRSYEVAEAEESTSDSRNYTDEITRNFFEAELMIGRKREKELTLKYLPTITVDELDAYGKSFGSADNRVILLGGPDPKAMPSQERVLQIVDEVSKRDIGPWEDKAITAKLMAQPPKPGTITKETKIDKIDVTEWTLSNGVRVILKPTDYQADQISLIGSSPGGLAMASDKDFNNARFADNIAEVGGLGDLDVETLQKLLVGKHVSVQTSIGETTENVDGSASAKDLDTMFQLIHLAMTQPRKDDPQIAVWKANFSEQLANRLRIPEVKFQIESQDVLYKHNLRRRAPTPDDVKRVDPDKALAFYKDRFGDASDFTFVIVGAFDPAKVRPLVETYLASLPAKGRKEKEKDAGVRKIGGVVKKTWNIGDEPKGRVNLVFHGDESWTRDKDRDMYILGQVLSIRLREILREDKGGVYGVGAFGQISRSPFQERTFNVSFGCEPKRVDELVKATFDEIADVAQHGIGDEYLEKIKQTFTREREVELRNNGFWVGWLSAAYRFGDDPTIVLDPSKMIARMTSDNVKAAAKRYLGTKEYYQAVLLPAADAAKAPAPAPAPAPARK